MPEESTRALLKLFGMAMTDFDDQTKVAVERLGAASPPLRPRGEVLELVEAWLKARGEVMARWGEVTRWLLETEAKGQADVLQVLAQWRQSGR